MLPKKQGESDHPYIQYILGSLNPAWCQHKGGFASSAGEAKLCEVKQTFGLKKTNVISAGAII